MKKIPLTQGQFALVADEWFEPLMTRHSWEKNQKPVKWCASWSPSTRSFYAMRHVYLPHGQRIVEYMHRRILGLDLGDKRQGDHINHQTLDNQLTNMRIVTQRGNQENRCNQSPYGVGIYYYRRRVSRPFKVRAQLDGERCHVGYFVTAEEARLAREKWLKERGLS